ncbi:hypothetical protein P43SY_009727 [Pythium insidiosum]|uniref:Vesicle transport v-SNARE N-terminal domain-containing protein n=1 Tax=Pythium insidiosum TaxID=114742 RepID=A0AAD5QBK2_PYTIN|nr:hypothetical protein P43SY_009727 [Pythium insidiosum]
MTTIFDGYDEEYRALTSDISKKISEVATYEDERDKKKTSIMHIGDLLTQANQLMSSADHRNRMKAATDKMKGTTDKLDAARRTVAETEEVALAITDELGRNREKIQAAHNKVKNVNDMARRGGNIVGRMSARDKRQQRALTFAACFIGLAIILVIYFGIFKRK